MTIFSTKGQGGGKPEVAPRDRRLYIALVWKEEGTQTMTLTLELSPEREAALKAQAQARGMSIEEWLLDLTEQIGPPAARFAPLPTPITKTVLFPIRYV